MPWSPHYDPFGAWPRFVRRVSDPVIQPLERRVTRMGGNPQDAPLWLLGIIVLGGLVLLTLVGWVSRMALRLAYMADAGPAAWLVAALGVSIIQARPQSWVLFFTISATRSAFVWSRLVRTVRSALPLKPLTSFNTFSQWLKVSGPSL